MWQNYTCPNAYLGGFPEARTLKTDKGRRSWHEDYLSAILERDSRDIINIRRQDAMLKLIQVLAAWSSKFMELSSICSQLSISRPSIESYIKAIETLYLVDRVRAWHKTDYDRVSKQEKLFLTDTGMLYSILNWRFDSMRFDADMSGKLLETFVYNQIAAIIDAQTESYEIYHYRDREKRENDDKALLG